MKISILSPDLSINCLGRAYLLARILQRRYEVEIVGPVFGDGIWRPLDGDKSVPFRAVDLSGRFRPYLRVGELVGKITGDVLYASKPFLTSFGSGLIKKKLNNCPLILDIDDWEIGSIREHYRNLSLAGRLRYIVGSTLFTYKMGSCWNILIHEKLIRFADEIIVSNRFLQKKYGGELIWHARDTEAFNPAKFDGGAIRDKNGIDKDRKVVMFLGTPRPHKGLEHAIRALTQVIDQRVMLVIVGMRADGYCKGLAHMGERLLGGRFKSLGMQPFGRLPELLAMADIVIIPQKRNPATVGQIPAKVFDAMTMAKPIIATAISDLPEILDGCGWVVEPDRPEQLADAMRSVLDNPGEAIERGRCARRKCIEKYSWDAMEKVLVNIFSKYE